MGYQKFGSGFSLNPLVGRRKSDRRTKAPAPEPVNLEEKETPEAEDPEIDAGPESWAMAARRELLEEISAFLLRHGLDVTPRNLSLAHTAMSGSDLALAQKIGMRENSGLTVNQEWLDSISRPSDAAAKQRELAEQLAATLEKSINSFAATTESARTATASYRGEMSEQLDKADATSMQGAPDDFIRISRAMLDTVQQFEALLQDSQAETEQLQQRLSMAREEANRDHLTGLPNRRAFEREFELAHDKALADGSPLFVAIVDIDHFKQVNDTFGHETGDRLLRAIAKILRKFASSDCFVARHGGEEFVILLHTASMDEARAQLERARREVEGRKFVARLQNRPIGKVTFSAGLSNVFGYDNPRDALAAADDALYSAKENGRNQVMLAKGNREAN